MKTKHIRCFIMFKIKQKSMVLDKLGKSMVLNDSVQLNNSLYAKTYTTNFRKTFRGSVALNWTQIANRQWLKVKKFLNEFETEKKHHKEGRKEINFTFSCSLGRSMALCRRGGAGGLGRLNTWIQNHCERVKSGELQERCSTSTQALQQRETKTEKC